MKPSQRPLSRKLFFIIAPVVLVLIAALAWVGIPALGWEGIAAMQAAQPPNPTPPLTQVAAQQMQETLPAPAQDVLSQDSTSSGEVAQIPEASPTSDTVSISLSNLSPVEHMNAEGVMVMAMRDGTFIHLFAYHPVFLPLTRITNNPWDDMAPALSPDRKRLAFSSRQNGYWDLYLIDLETGMRTRLTDTPEYETSPTWAPDGQWIAYERFDGGNQEIYILPLNEPAEPIRLTDSPGQDYAPAWSPLGRQIAFVSNRSGDDDIWIADLDQVDNRFTNLSQDNTAQDRYPAWSQDGSHLAWASEKAGSTRLVVWKTDPNQRPVRLAAEGRRPAWSPDGKLLFTELRGPNQVDLTAYTLPYGRVSLQPIPLAGALYGMTWVPGPLPAKLSEAILQGDQTSPPVLYQPVLTRFPIAPIGRMSLVPLEDVDVSQPLLHDVADDAFNDLRRQIGIEAGWDALSTLENAFVPVTTPNDPANEDEWLYTGRAFALNPLLMNAGWMTLVHEEYAGQTYWRIYLKARYQDGSMGMPISDAIWDLNARYAGNTRFYEEGGRPLPALPGYWIDLTELASRYGWERLPSLTSWRTYYPAIRFNQFAITGGIDWRAAMAEIYPPEALVTITPYPTYTALPSITPETPVDPSPPTATPTITPYPTRRPTWTPLPNFSP